MQTRLFFWLSNLLHTYISLNKLSDYILLQFATHEADGATVKGERHEITPTVGTKLKKNES